jgi:hypothetical protein
MTLQEILNEINRVKTRVETEKLSSIEISELTVALVCLYDEYVRQTLTYWRK